jgi:hypothetical protein
VLIDFLIALRGWQLWQWTLMNDRQLNHKEASSQSFLPHGSQDAKHMELLAPKESSFPLV